MFHRPRSVAILLPLLLFSAGHAAGQSAVRAADHSPLKDFWAAVTVGDRAIVAKKIIASGFTFDEALAALRRGRTYSSEVPRGTILREHQIDGVRHPYAILVPEDYSPTRPLPVRFDLHGGMGASRRNRKQSCS